MLKKLLRYDLRAIFRVWWIAALATVAMSVMGGFAWRVLDSTKLYPDIVNATAGIVLFFSYFCIVALPLMATVLIFIRFYKNFFTDEGYLTFTLPAKRETLLNSKLIASSLATLASTAVCLLDCGVILFIFGYEEIVSPEFIPEVQDILFTLWQEVGPILTVYCLEGLIIVVLLLVMSVLFLCCCITFGSMIVKKGKLIASIGIYYLANGLFASISQIFMIFGMGSMVIWWEPLSILQRKNLLALIMLAVILFLGMLCALLYALQYWMLDKKLNLS